MILRRERGDQKKIEPRKKICEDDEGEERLKVPPDVAAGDDACDRPRVRGCRMVPKTKPLKAKTVATKEPAQRPPR